jgi:hypothetical protein
MSFIKGLDLGTVSGQTKTAKLFKERYRESDLPLIVPGWTR